MAEGNGSLERPLDGARISSSVPGRMRLRLGTAASARRRLAAAADALADTPEVTAAIARGQTGSLLIEYDAVDEAALWERLEELGLDRTNTVSGDHVAPPSERVTRLLSRTNDAVAQRTGGNDLRTLAPIGFGLLALRQFVRDDKRLADAPWYVLAWYASETFQRFHDRTEGDHDG